MEEGEFRVWVLSPVLGSFVLVYLCSNVSYSTPDAAAVASKGYHYVWNMCHGRFEETNCWLNIAYRGRRRRVQRCSMDILSEV